MTRCAALALLVGITLGCPTRALGQDQGIEQLGWLIGEWTFEDREIEGEYRETGTRVCEYALGREYIVCESHGVDHRGRERSYLWYFNYNHVDDRYEVTSLLQGFPRKLLYTVEVHDGGHRLEIAYGSWEADGVVVEGGATVRYNGSDQYVWGNARYRDLVSRR